MMHLFWHPLFGRLQNWFGIGTPGGRPAVCLGSLDGCATELGTLNGGGWDLGALDGAGEHMGTLDGGGLSLGDLP